MAADRRSCNQWVAGAALGWGTTRALLVLLWLCCAGLWASERDGASSCTVTHATRPVTSPYARAVWRGVDVPWVSVSEPKERGGPGRVPWVYRLLASSSAGRGAHGAWFAACSPPPSPRPAPWSPVTVFAHFGVSEGSDTTATAKMQLPLAARLLPAASAPSPCQSRLCGAGTGEAAEGSERLRERARWVFLFSLEVH